MKIVMFSVGDAVFYKEAREGIEHLRRIGFKGEIDWWVDKPDLATGVDASVFPVELPDFRCTAVARAWLIRAQLAHRETAETYCVLDSYARVLNLAKFEEAGTFAQRFGICLPTDIRRTLGRDLTGRGSTASIVEATRPVPRQFPLWNLGVIFGTQAASAKTLLGALSRYLEEQARAFGDGRDQPLFCKAVWDTGIVPLMLPDSFNVRRPFVKDPVILHTRVFGHYYGMPEVDTPLPRRSRIRQRIKIRAFEALRLWPLVSA